jgi:poly-gamma-glutamate synthesis protein (capsule biosynthesis protein)
VIQFVPKSFCRKVGPFLLVLLFLGFGKSKPEPYFDPIESEEPILPKQYVPDEYINTRTGKRYIFKDTTKLLFAGDTMFNWGVRETIEKNGYEDSFREWKPIFEKADLRFLNLETPIIQKHRSGTRDKSYVFYGFEEDIEFLKYLNLSAVFLGNNHAMDFDAEGLSDTIKLLNKHSIPHLGAGMDENSAFGSKTFPTKAGEIWMLSTSEVGERHLFARGSRPGVAYFYESKVIQILKANQRSNPRIRPILNLHWGWEYNPEPSPGQKKSAYRMIDAGFDAIVGHHPHIPQGIEIYKGKPIVYSLGNFVFGSKNAYLNHNLVLIMHYKKNRLFALELIPAFGKFFASEFAYHPLDPEEADVFLEEYSILCKKLGTKLEIRGGRGYVFLDTK